MRLQAPFQSDEVCLSCYSGLKAEIERLQEEQTQIARILRCSDAEDISTPSNLPNVIRDKVIEIERLRARKQIGWYCPGSKRFCYSDEKEQAPDYKRSYTVPVFVEAAEAKGRAGK